METAASHPRIAHFLDFELDLQTGDLTRNDRTIRLPEKPFQALMLLIERQGDVVSREALAAGLWSAETFVEFDANLNATIKRLRDALEESAETPRCIETIPRRGYRFVPPVRMIARRPSGVHESFQSRPRFAPLWVSGVVTLLVGFGAVVGLRWYERRASPPPIAKLGVLAFDNVSGGADAAGLTSGIGDDVVARLRRVSPSQLMVITVRPNPANGETRGNHLAGPRVVGLDYTMTGRLEQRGEGWELRVTFADARTQHQRWAVTYQLPLQAPFIQHDVSRRVVEALSLRAPLEDRQDLSRAAYDAYLRGQDALKTDDVPHVQTAADWFDQSVRRDPLYARAYAGLAQASWRLGQLHAQSLPDAEARARGALAAGLRLDARVPEFYLIQASLLAKDPGHDAEIIEAYHRAVALDPNAINVRTQYALFLRERQPGQALAEITRALTLDPQSSVLTAYRGWVLTSARRFEEAEAALQDARRLDPDLPMTMRFLGVLAEQRGRMDDSTTWFERAAAASGRQPYYVYRLGVAYARAGHPSRVRAILQELRDQSVHEFVEPKYLQLLEDALSG